jgi:hypothetical protein
MRHFPWRELGWSVGFVVLSVALYVGSYRAMVIPHHFQVNPDGSLSPEYRFGHAFCVRFYAPIYEAEVSIFPESREIHDKLMLIEGDVHY